MTESPLSPSARAMLAKPNPAVIATTRRDGQPVSAATWYLLQDDGRVLVNMDEGRVRLQHLRRDPRVSLTVIDQADFYTHLTLIGRVVDIHDDPDLVDIDALSRHYTEQPYARRDRLRVSAVIEVDRVHGWGEQKNNDQAS